MEMTYDDMIYYFEQFLIGGEKINHDDERNMIKKNTLY